MKTQVIDKKKTEVQKKALTAWINAGKRGTIEIITGLGKNRIALEAAKLESKSAKILFLAEVTDRERELRIEQEKWAKDLNVEIEFACYQTVYKWFGKTFDLVIADEIHDSLTKEYSKFYKNNTIKHIIGLSATIDENAEVETEDELDFLTKGEILKDIAPVCFTYGLDKGQKDGTSRKLDIYVISHKLDMHKKNIQAGNKTKVFYQTEWGAYNYKDSQFKKALFAPEAIRSFRIRVTSAARAKLLYNLPSKVITTKELIKGIKGRTIIFGNSLDALSQVTPNVISSHNTAKQNEAIRDSFEAKETNIIAAFKKLKQGANLTDLDNCIIMSYYSKEKDLIQRIGRLRDNGEVGRIFILVTFGTQEVKWFDSMFENVESLNIINCNGVADCLDKLSQ